MLRLGGADNQFITRFAQAPGRAEVVRCEVLICNATNQNRWFEIELQPQFCDESDFVKFIVILTDTSERLTL